MALGHQKGCPAACPISIRKHRGSRSHLTSGPGSSTVGLGDKLNQINCFQNRNELCESSPKTMERGKAPSGVAISVVNASAVVSPGGFRESADVDCFWQFNCFYVLWLDNSIASVGGDPGRNITEKKKSRDRYSFALNTLYIGLSILRPVHWLCEAKESKKLLLFLKRVIDWKQQCQ